MLPRIIKYLRKVRRKHALFDTFIAVSFIPFDAIPFPIDPE